MKQSSDQQTQPALSIATVEPQDSLGDVPKTKPQRYAVISVDVTYGSPYKSLEPNSWCVQFALAEDNVEAQQIASKWSGNGVCPLAAYSKQDLLDLIRCMEEAEISEAHPSTIDDLSYVPSEDVPHVELDESFTLTDDPDLEDLTLEELQGETDLSITSPSQQAADCALVQPSTDQCNIPSVSTGTA